MNSNEKQIINQISPKDWDHLKMWNDVENQVEYQAWSQVWIRTRSPIGSQIGIVRSHLIVAYERL